MVLSTGECELSFLLCSRWVFMSHYILKWLFWKQIIISIARWASVSHHIHESGHNYLDRSGCEGNLYVFLRMYHHFLALTYIVHIVVLKKTNFGLVTSRAQRLSGSSRHQVGSPNKEGRTSVHSIGDRRPPKTKETQAWVSGKRRPPRKSALLQFNWSQCAQTKPPTAREKTKEESWRLGRPD